MTSAALAARTCHTVSPTGVPAMRARAALVRCGMGLRSATRSATAASSLDRRRRWIDEDVAEKAEGHKEHEADVQHGVGRSHDKAQRDPGPGQGESESDREPCRGEYAWNTTVRSEPHDEAEAEYQARCDQASA